MKRNLTEAVADYLKARPNVWIDGMELSKIAGAYAWRSRVSQARRQFSMTILNRVERDRNGVAKSLYKFVPPGQQELGL